MKRRRKRRSRPTRPPKRASSPTIPWLHCLAAMGDERWEEAIVALQRFLEMTDEPKDRRTAFQNLGACSPSDLRLFCTGRIILPVGVIKLGIVFLINRAYYGEKVFLTRVRTAEEISKPCGLWRPKWARRDSNRHRRSSPCS